MKTSNLLFALALAATSANAAIIGQLGILDDTANGGINPATGAAWAPGDTYRLIFLSSETTSTTSSDISTYNSTVQGWANAAGLGGATWNVVGSTGAVDARDNTGTNPGSGTGVAFFKMDGTTLLANNNADLWNNGVDAFVDIDEYGNVVTTNTDRIATGSDGDGTVGPSGREFGSGGNVRTGHAGKTGQSWMIDFNAANTGRRVFAMSELLTVPTPAAAIPEPSSIAVLGFGALALIGRRRR